MPKILIVENDSDTAEIISQSLSSHYNCDAVRTGSQALLQLNLCRYDLLLLGQKLADSSGMEVLQRFRGKGGKTPVIMLIDEGSITDKIKTLESGADDYLTKPIFAKELLAKVRVRIRRLNSDDKETIIRVRDLALDWEARRVFRGDSEIRLTATEFALLEYFMRNSKSVFSAEELIAAVWRNDSRATAGSVTSCIKRLRQKLDVDDQPSFIRSLYGLGYGLW